MIRVHVAAEKSISSVMEDKNVGKTGDKIMEKREVKIHGIYKHFKNKYYIVEDMAFHSETKEEYVVYRRHYATSST